MYPPTPPTRPRRAVPDWRLQTLVEYRAQPAPPEAVKPAPAAVTAAFTIRQQAAYVLPDVSWAASFPGTAAVELGWWLAPRACTAAAAGAGRGSRRPTPWRALQAQKGAVIRP